eukprot:SAG25_NODE_1206_length_3615_cov_16.817975_1_plen_69_part_10
MSEMYLCRRFRLRFTDVGDLPMSEAAPCALCPPPPPPRASLAGGGGAGGGVGLGPARGGHRPQKGGGAP